MVIYSKVFAQACALIEEQLFSLQLVATQWPGIRLQYGTQVNHLRSSADLSRLLNKMLEQLHCSHARLFTKNDIEYFQLLESFGDASSPKGNNAFLKAAGKGFRGIGAVTEKHGDRQFIRWVLDGSPAQQAGLTIGDQVVEADGIAEDGMRCLAASTASPVTLRIKRSARSRPVSISVTPAVRRATDWLYSASSASIRIIHRAGMRIGYLHFWSTSGIAYEELLREQIGSGTLRDADALLLDLRGLVGGACPSLLNVFCPNIPILEYIDRRGFRQVVDSQWRKPVVFLINEYTRSGNEVLAYGAWKYRLGDLVGTQTAGAVLAGKPYLLADQTLLYLPVADVLVDGMRIEGSPIQPTVLSNYTVPYTNGKDKQLEQGVKVLLLKNRATS